MNPPRTLGDLLAPLERRGAREAVGVCGAYGVRVWSAARLSARVASAAAWCEARGIERGARLALWAQASPEWVAAFLGLVARGVVVVPIDRDLPREQALRIARGCACRALLHDDPTLRADADRLACFRLAALTEDGGSAAPPAPVALRPDDPAAVLFTSGTTAEPRGIVLTHANLLASVRPFLRWRLPLRWLSLRLLVLPPPSHALGLVVGVVLPLALGLTALHAPTPDVARVVRLIRGHRIALAILVPRLLEQLRQELLRTRVGSRHALAARLAGARGLRRAALIVWHRGELLGRNRFRGLLCGGAALPAEAEAFWRASGVLLVQGYGLAETAALATVAAPLRERQVGRALPGLELRVDESGEVRVRGASLSPGTLDLDGVFTPAALDGDGFLATGDLGRLDARGRLVLFGRRKEVIVTSEGHNVAPDEVEAALRREPGLRDCAVVARLCEAGEEVHAVLLPSPGVDPAAAVRAANARLPEFARVRGFSLWPGDELPRAALGKLRRLEVQRLVQSRAAPAAPAEPVTLDALLAEPDRERRVAGLAKLLAMRPDALLEARQGLREAFGLASLDVVELLARVERESGRLDATPLLRADARLADLAAALCAPAPASSRRLPQRQPWWARSLPLRLLRPWSRAWLLRLWGARLRLEVVARDKLDLGAPLLIAAAPHRHWLDALTVAAALPRRLRRRLMLVTNHDFGPWFAPRPGTPGRERLASAWAYFVGLPLLFEFAILTPDARAREGLYEVARALDRGLCPLIFPYGLRFGAPQPQAPGLALLAQASGRPILPLHVMADDAAWRLRRLWPRPRVRVRFGTPLVPRVDEPREALMARLDAAFAELEAAARQARPKPS